MQTDTVRLAVDSTAHVRFFETLEHVAVETAELLSDGSIALSGGATYRTLFPLWAARHSTQSRARFYPVDERLVPFEDPASNWRMACELLLRPLGRESDQDHFPVSATMYAQLLHRELGTSPAFDTVFLGAGTDGHTASLFPGGAYLDDTDAVVLETQSPRPPSRRVTLGPGVLARSRTLIAIIAGDGKQSVVERLLRADAAIPIVSVLRRHPSPLVYIDSALHACP